MRVARRFVGRVVAAVITAFLLAASSTSQLRAAEDPLPSWNEGETKSAILEFVRRATTPGTPDFVPQPERIAVFDNDGTLWCEQPAYVQLAYVFHWVRRHAAEHPEWNTEEPFRSALAGDYKAVAATGEKGLLKLIMATHAGITPDEFKGRVDTFLASAKHPRFDRPYTECVYQPMLELLAYLRSAGFKTFIVSGGGVEFIRPWAEKVYGIPPEQVVGSSIKLKYEDHTDVPQLRRLPEVDFIDDGPGKPVGIQRFIGRRPIMAFGNSDGDYEMLAWTTLAARRPSFALIVHHTDAEREYAYDRESHFGKLSRALDDAEKYEWAVVDMRKDWKVVFPPK